MIKFFPITILLFILTGHSGFGQTTFQKTYGGNDSDEGYSVQQTTDGGYVITGSTNSFGAGSGDIYLLKTDSFGNLEWTKTYGGIHYDEGYSVQQTPDGGFIIAGGFNIWGSSSEDICLIKTDSNGDTVWTKAYGGNGADAPYFMTRTSDGGYIIAGSTKSFGVLNGDALLIKTDSSGNVLWSNAYGGMGVDVATCVVESNDGGFVAAGYSNSFGSWGTSFYLFKTDSSGNAIWSKTYGDMGIGSVQKATYVQKTNDNGFILIGWRNDISTGCGDYIYVVKTDSAGNLQWSKHIAQNFNMLEEKWSILQRDDGGFMIVGSLYDCIAYQLSVYLIRTNIFGTPMWGKTFGLAGIHDGALSFQQTSDDGYIITGITEDSISGHNVYLIKLDSNSISGCYESNLTTPTSPVTTDTVTAATTVTGIPNIETTAVINVSSGGSDSIYCFSAVGIKETENKESLIVSPNPFTSSVSIKGVQNGEIRIFDLTGTEILRQRIINQETKINTEHLSPGFYLLNYSAKGKLVNYKIIKL